MQRLRWWRFPAYDNANGTVTATTHGASGDRWVRSTLDGFGRAVKVEKGNGTTTVSTTETIYGPCACSPLGKVAQVSQPYAPGGTKYYTTYAYDGVGRTSSVQLPDGASRTQYTYQGNVTTVTDPAGHWKQYARDALGNLRTVLEPDPAVSPMPGPPNPPPAYPVSSAPTGTLLTVYTYDLLNHLIQVSMPRQVNGTLVTQTRTFSYDSATQRLLSATNPENGTVSYTYSADGSMATRLDAKGQKTAYSYDTYGRLAQIRHYPDGTNEDTAQQVNLYYDNNYAGSGPNT